MPLPGGAVPDPASRQNFDALDGRIGRIESTTLSGTRGVAQAEWPGASFFSDVVEVEHGLGETPTTAQATLYDDESEVLGWATIREITTSKLVIYAMYFQEPAEGAKAKVLWTAYR